MEKAFFQEKGFKLFHKITISCNRKSGVLPLFPLPKSTDFPDYGLKPII
jgi:hypothetical protein